MLELAYSNVFILAVILGVDFYIGKGIVTVFSATVLFFLEKVTGVEYVDVKVSALWRIEHAIKALTYTLERD